MEGDTIGRHRHLADLGSIGEHLQAFHEVRIDQGVADQRGKGNGAAAHLRVFINDLLEHGQAHDSPLPLHLRIGAEHAVGIACVGRFNLQDQGGPTDNFLQQCRLRGRLLVRQETPGNVHQGFHR